MANYQGGPLHGKGCHIARVGAAGEKPPKFDPETTGPIQEVEHFVRDGTRFLHAISESDPGLVAVYIAKGGHLVYECEQRFTKPYPTTIEPQMWDRMRHRLE